MNDQHFKARTRQLYATARRRGAARFTLAELREALAVKLATRPLCRHCGALLSVADVSLDHARPLARGGQNTLANIEFICLADNRSKGKMTADEYTILLKALDAAGRESRYPQLRGEVLTALRVANRFRLGSNWRTKREAASRG